MFAIGEAARQSGVGIETIRYYEREGIIPPPGRTASGRRVYSQEEVSLLRFIRTCRDLGFAIADIRQLMELCGETAPSCAHAESVGRKQLQAVRERMAELARIEAALEELLMSCEGNTAACPMLAELMHQ